jgi:hypothetical protein
MAFRGLPVKKELKPKKNLFLQFGDQSLSLYPGKWKAPFTWHSTDPYSGMYLDILTYVSICVLILNNIKVTPQVPYQDDLGHQKTASNIFQTA